ncbi:hypothetical protein GOP47_0008391 [Adiantum capillus-veneris]|uniref:Uncharacterized protein n=1 Tax=Adiantum capillus-veneris TaxID=13818 RepID=A0A9D4UYQ8_ADICA|nr:hypothetical protein GOP47_0008391 [Adiantum capillus-veneris]
MVSLELRIKKALVPAKIEAMKMAPKETSHRICKAKRASSRGEASLPLRVHNEIMMHTKWRSWQSNSSLRSLGKEMGALVPYC